MKALEVITDALERINKLSPGETPDADLVAFCFRRLNLLVDELSAPGPFLFQVNLTSAAQTGPMTLGAGDWAAIRPGTKIISMTANNLVMSPMTMQQYNELYQPNLQGNPPSVWAHDGFATVYLWPAATGQVIKIETRATVSTFADANTTDYIVPDGWRSALGAGLAVRIAPVLLGGVTPDLLRAEKRAMSAIEVYEPAIIDVYTYNDTDCHQAAFPYVNAGGGGNGSGNVLTDQDGNFIGYL